MAEKTTKTAKRNYPAQGPVGIWGPEDGESYWQPEPAHGYITLKITPETFPTNLLAAGLQVVEPGCAIRQHGHHKNEELLFVWQGRGTVYLDGAPHPVEPGSLVYVGRYVKHGFVNDGEDPLKLLWVMMPPGLETVVREAGAPRLAGCPRPERFGRPDNMGEILDRGGFAKPEDLVPEGIGR